jgi:2-dehydropantoate 2-reductase
MTKGIRDMRILVIGAGATGGYFGGRLAEAGRDVTFLVRPRRAEQLAANGLQLVSPNGDATIHPQLVTAGTIGAPFDVVMLTVKAYALEAALEDMAPAIGSATMIFPVLNGMRHIDLLTARFGEDKVLGGVCLVATMLDDKGRVVQLTGMQELAYGERDGSASARVEALDAQMQGAGFTAKSSQTIMQQMWEKWVFLATLGGITCLMRGTIGEIEAAPGGADLALQLLAECSAVAAAAGYAPGNDFSRRVTGTLTTAGSPMASSMYRDLQKGNPVEVDQILGDLLARARGFGVATPLLATAFAALRVYHQRAG